jgi:hypothetical protein
MQRSCWLEVQEVQGSGAAVQKVQKFSSSVALRACSEVQKSHLNTSTLKHLNS